jgi:hypothetical protein
MHQIGVLLLLPITTSGVEGDLLNVMLLELFTKHRRRKAEILPFGWGT